MGLTNYKYPNMANVIRDNAGSTNSDLIKKISNNEKAKKEMDDEIIGLKNSFISDKDIESRLSSIFNLILWDLMHEDSPPKFVRIQGYVYERL